VGVIDPDDPDVGDAMFKILATRTLAKPAGGITRFVPTVLMIHLCRCEKFHVGFVLLG
jgi:hypothetical protein